MCLYKAAVRFIRTACALTGALYSIHRYYTSSRMLRTAGRAACAVAGAYSVGSFVNAERNRADQLLGRNWIADAVEKSIPAVVNIKSDAVSSHGLGNVGQATGSGFIIDKSGLIATNAHVVAHSQIGASTLTVRPAVQNW